MAGGLVSLGWSAKPCSEREKAAGTTAHTTCRAWEVWVSFQGSKKPLGDAEQSVPDQPIHVSGDDSLCGGRTEEWGGGAAHAPVQAGGSGRLGSGLMEVAGGTDWGWFEVEGICRRYGSQ